MTDPLSLYAVVTLALPAAFVVAGLLAPSKPFLTGFMLSLIYGSLLMAIWVIDQPTYTIDAPVLIPLGFVLVVAFVALGVGTLVTGLIGYVTRWIYAKVRGR